jgi:hypothetical protein
VCSAGQVVAVSLKPRTRIVSGPDDQPRERGPRRRGAACGPHDLGDLSPAFRGKAWRVTDCQLTVS